VAAVAAGAAGAAAAGSSDVVVEQDWKAEARARHEAAAVKAGKTKNLRTGRSVKMMATVVQKKKEKKQAAAAAAAAAAAPTVGSTMNENGDGDGFMSFEVNTEQRLQSGNTNRDHPAEEEEEDQEIMNFDDFFATTEDIGETYRRNG